MVDLERLIGRLDRRSGKAMNDLLNALADLGVELVGRPRRRPGEANPAEPASKARRGG